MARWVWPIGLLFVWVIRHQWGCSTWWASMFTLVPEPAWLFAASFWCVAVFFPRFAKCRLPAISALLLALAINEPQIRTPGPKIGLKVMQLNMQHGVVGVDKVAALIEREHPDILFLQEAGSLDKPYAQVAPSLRRALDGYAIYRIKYEAIAVRGTLIAQETVETGYGLDGRRKFITTAVAKVAGETLSVATLHFQPTQEDKLFTKPSAALNRLVRVGEVRKLSYAVLARWLSEQPPGKTCIVAGDFNEHPVGPNYRLLGAQAKDAWAEAGVGLGFTIPASPPFERIDHIWVRNGDAVRAEVLPDIVSDHRGVVAWVKPRR